MGLSSFLRIEFLSLGAIPSKERGVNSSVVSFRWAVTAFREGANISSEQRGQLKTECITKSSGIFHQEIPIAFIRLRSYWDKAVLAPSIKQVSLSC